MSTPAQPAEKTAGEDARNFLVREVFAPVFFQKLAQHGLGPQTQDEATELLRIGQTLLDADARDRAKQAATRVDFLKQAGADLDAEFRRRYGTAPPAAGPTAEGQFVTKFAAELGADPRVQAAVEQFNQAVAAEEAALAAAA